MTRARRLLVPGLSTLAMLVILCGLGTWQVQRLARKTGILAQIAAAEALPAVPLPPDPSPFAKVRIEGRLRDDLAASYAAEVHDTAGRALSVAPFGFGVALIAHDLPFHASASVANDSVFEL